MKKKQTLELNKLARILTPLLLSLSSISSHAISIDLGVDANTSRGSSTSGLLLGSTNCSTHAEYRFKTNTTVNNSKLDILVTVLDQSNLHATDCINYRNGSIYVLFDAPNQQKIYTDLEIKLVESDTNTPVVVNSLTAIFADLDANSSNPNANQTDDVYLSDGARVSLDRQTHVRYEPDTSLSTDAGVNYESGVLRGRADANCSSNDGKCVGTATWLNTSTINLRLQNNFSTNKHMEISFNLDDASEVDFGTDKGDAPNSYLGATHIISPLISLGDGLFPDHDETDQYSSNATGDDTDPTIVDFSSDDDSGPECSAEGNSSESNDHSSSDHDDSDHASDHSSNKNNDHSSSDHDDSDHASDHSSNDNNSQSTNNCNAKNIDNGDDSNQESDDHSSKLSDDHSNDHSSDHSNDHGSDHSSDHGSDDPQGEENPGSGSNNESNVTSKINYDDEESVLLINEVDSRDNYNLDVKVNNETNKTATLTGWIDLDRNGSFDSDEATSLDVAAGTIASTTRLTWNDIPTDIKNGKSYLRLRFTTDSNIDKYSPGTFIAQDGEVEDYTVTINVPSACSALDQNDNVNVSLTPISTLKSNNLFLLATNNTSNRTGKITAYRIGSDSFPSNTESWEASDAMERQNQRGSRIYSTSSSGSKILFKNLQDAAFNNAGGIPDNDMIIASIETAIMGSISPNSNLAILGNKVNPSLYLNDPHYKIFYHSTISQHSSSHGATIPSLVLSTSDDGFLYAFRQEDGNLSWGWTPRSLVQEMNKPATFNGQHFMQGTVDIKDVKTDTTYATYVIGSYKDGLGQYVLKLNNDSSLNSIIWDIDYSSENTSSSPNHGKRAYFKDALGKTYMAYIVTNTSDVSTLHIRSIADASINHSVTLAFNATSSPYITAADNTLYLGDSNGNIYSAPLLVTSGADKGYLNSIQTLTSSLAPVTSKVGSMHSSDSSAVTFIGKSGVYLRAQSEDRLTLFKQSTRSSWTRKWSTTIGEGGRWGIDPATSSSVLTADTDITALPRNAVITDEAYIVANSLVLPVSVSASSGSCSSAYYYLYNLSNGHFPIKRFYHTSDDSAITGRISLGNGSAKHMLLAQQPASKKLIGLGLSDQKTDGSTGLNASFYFEDRVQTGIRSWKEL